jgi:imidazolonepropionase-like amidohydrolase
VLRKEKDLGRVAKGYIADLVVVRGDPMADLTVIRKPVVVLKVGKIELDCRSAP